MDELGSSCSEAYHEVKHQSDHEEENSEYTGPEWDHSSHLIECPASGRSPEAPGRQNQEREAQCEKDDGGACQEVAPFE